ncbi:MAG: sensor histidine kinase [Candidatus Hydrogenedentes bacterium]|nr:sensor histidine kinase [Candidatus Hydrogenedentota bacterium]
MAETKVFGTLRSRIFAALFAISLIPIGVLGAQGYHCAMQAVYELAHKHVLAVAVGRSTAVATWIEERTKSVETIAAHPATARLLSDLKNGDESARNILQKSLDSFRHVNSTFGAVVLLDTQWLPVAESLSLGHHHHSLADIGLQASAELAEGIAYGLAHGHVAGDVGLHMVCVVKDPDQNTVGFLAAYLDMTKRLTPILQDRQGLYETGKVYIVSAEDDILTEPLADENVALSKWKKSAAASAHVHDPSANVESYRDYEGNLVLGTSMPIGFEGWRLVTEIDSAEALAWLEILLARVLATGVVTCVVVVGIAFWISHLVGKPLRDLMRISHRIRAGHVDERLAQMDVNEAEEVRKAFNAMLDQLQEKQDELVRTARLAYVGELTSSTVHEMRNPLSSIKLNLQAMCRTIPEAGHNKERGESALQQAIRLERMLTDPLSFGKPVVLSPVRLSFDELTKAIEDVVGNTAAQGNVALNFEDSLDGRTLHVDKEQMCRALTNLIGNALEAMSLDGSIVLEARASTDPHGGVDISVSDTGPGLSGEAIQRAFQPFYTTKREGTGLGLPNVKNIVELHGGTITVENGAVNGAVFRIHLPDKCLREA